MKDNLSIQASANMIALGRNPYPGRGIVLGTSLDGHHHVQIYWIMGRSGNSRNRIFVYDKGTVATEVADPSKMQNPELVIYEAMKEEEGIHVVSNGHQTTDVLHGLNCGDPLSTTLNKWDYEPDAPHFTPRITGYHDSRTSEAGLAIIRKSDWSSATHCFVFEYENIAPGFGYSLTTYSGDGSPLPPFTGEPLLYHIGSGLEQVTQSYWETLDCENLVALAVKFIDPVRGESEVKILNKYTRVGT